MSQVPRTCHLNSLVIGRDQIQLPHEENVLIDGKEIFPDVEEVSDLRLFAMANCNTGSVVIEVIGLIHCRHKGRVLTRGAKYLFGAGNIIQFNGTAQEYEYEICFNPRIPDYITQRDLPRLIENTASDPECLTNYIESTWQDYDNGKLLIYTPYLLNQSAGVVGFSLHDVLVKQGTWILKYENIKKRMEKLRTKNHKIVIFTSQTKTEKRKIPMKVYKKNVETFLSQFGLPIQLFVVTGETKYKKPIPYMWQIMEEYFNSNIIIEPDRCYYIGSSLNLIDRLFAANLEIRFFTCEEYFKLQIVPTPQLPQFNPKNFQTNEILFSLVISAIQEIIVMVGRPCSGKTFFCKNYLHDYHYSYVTGTTHHTIARLKKYLTATKRSVVIDGINHTKKLRQEYIKIAKEFNVACRCFVMDVSRGQARHINKLMELTNSCYNMKEHLDEMLDDFDALYEPPEMDEGFNLIMYLPFMSQYFNDEQRKLYGYFLLSD